MEKPPLQTVSEIGDHLGRLTRAPNKDLLVKSLREAANALSQVQQPVARKSEKKAARKVRESSIGALTGAIIKHQLLRHSDKDIKLLVGVCVSDVFRILAPDPPFADQHLRGVFELFINMFGQLGDTSSPYFSRRVKVLETVAQCRCCVIMLDIDCTDLLVKMFDAFFSVVSQNHQQSLISNMMCIITTVLSEEPSPSLVDVVLRNLVKRDKDKCTAASKLAVSIIETCAENLEPYVRGFLTSCFLDRDSVESEIKELYHEILLRTFECAPQMLISVIPSLTLELVTDQVDIRIKAVSLVGKLISLPGHHVAQEYRNLFMEFKNRFSDKSVEVRISAMQCAKACYMANPSGDISHALLTTLEGRLLDFDDRVRVHAVTILCDLASSNPKSFPPEVISSATERLRDKKISVRKKALQKLIELYRDYCDKCAKGFVTACDIFEQIPCKILMLYYDKDSKEFRSQNLEVILTEELFPTHLTVEQRMTHWIYFFSLFTPLHEKALNTILSQKRRLQTEVLNYLAMRRKEKDISPEQLQKRLRNSYAKMSAFFPVSSGAEECFCKLNGIKDDKIFNALEQLLGERSIEKAQTARDNFLKMVGDKHPYYEFLHALSAKCLFNIFGLEDVYCILDHLLGRESRNEHSDIASTKLLVAIISNFPVLLSGTEEKYLELLKRNTTDHTLVQCLAKAAPYISVKFSDFYPLLKRVCQEGSRIQSKHAVSAMASLVGSSEQLIFSDLCKELVHSLHGGRNIPTLLQSFGCIAQHCVSAFEEIYAEVRSYIIKRVFEGEECKDSSSVPESGECCDSCKLKIYGLKVLAKSFLPRQGSRVNGKIKELLEILAKMLQPGDAVGCIMSCARDRQHLRLAAAKCLVQLSRRWDLYIPPDLFRSVVLTAKNPSSSVKKIFLAKISKMLKGRAIPIRYACTFALAASDSCKVIQDEAIQYMEEFIKEYNGGPRSPVSVEKEALITDYPAYIVVFLIHILAHEPDFPHVSQNEEEHAEFLRPLFWVLQLLLNSTVSNGSMDYLKSIFRAIRKAEDALDAQITPKLQYLAETGIAFLDALNRNAISPSRPPPVILLPSSFYRCPLVKKCDPANVNSPSPITVERCFVKRIFGILESQFSMNLSSIHRHGNKCQEEHRKAINMKGDMLESVSSEVNSSKVETERQQIGFREICAGHKQKRARSPNTFTLPGLQKDSSVIDGLQTCAPKCSEAAPANGSAAIKPCLMESQASICKSEKLASPKEHVGTSTGFTAESFLCLSPLKHPCGATIYLLIKKQNTITTFFPQELSIDVELLIGKRIKLLSPVDGCFHPGTVVSFDSNYKTHKVSYDSGDVEVLSLDSETWEAIDDNSLIDKSIQCQKIVLGEDSHSLHGDLSRLAGCSCLCDPEDTVDTFKDCTSRQLKCTASTKKGNIASGTSSLHENQMRGKKSLPGTTKSEVTNGKEIVIAMRKRRKKA